MMRIILAYWLAAVALAGCAVHTEESSVTDTPFVPGDCAVGIYGVDQPFVAVTRRDAAFRYSVSDGRTGRIDEAANAGPETTLVVMAHGSEELGWIEAVSYPYQLVGRGISVFVYDKRGTGQSGGEYSQNFPQLADDLVAAWREAKRLATGRFGRLGLFGFSQGGWIAPLAAERSGAEFLGIGYGLVVDILEEDASQVELELRGAGYGDDVIRKATELREQGIPMFDRLNRGLTPAWSMVTTNC